MDCGAGEEYEGNQRSWAHQKVPSVVPGWLQSLVAMATGARQLVAPEPVTRLQAGRPHVPMLARHRATVERALGGMPGREEDGAEQDVPVQAFLWHFG